MTGPVAVVPARTACIAAALAALATPALAADDAATTWYAGGAVVFGNLKFDDAAIDDDAAGGRVSLGYRFNRWFGIEGSWLETADFEDDQLPAQPGGDAELGLDGFTLSAVGYAPYISNEDLAFYGKAGVYVLDQNLVVRDAAGVATEGSARRIDGLAVGAGLRAKVSERVDMRAEGEWFDLDGADLWLLSLGVDYRFGAPR